MTTVPNWIAKAVIVSPTRTREASLTEIRDWRATKTQVVVTDEHGRERRFYLDTLTEVGQSRLPRSSNRLAAPDDPAVVKAIRARAVAEASWMVISEMERQRFQDHTDDAELMVKKLTALRDAASSALASLTEVL